MEIEILKEQHYQAYDAFLLSCEDSLLYQSSRYMALLVDLLGCRQATLLARDKQGNLLAALPLMEADGPFGVVVNSLPFFGSNGGVIGSSAAACHALLRTYNTRVAQKDVAAATVVENPLTCNRSILWRHELTDERIGQFTPIGYALNHGDALMASFHHKTRNAIRKAWKLGATVSVENDALDFLVGIHELNMHEIGGAAKSRRFFELVPRHFRPDEDFRVYVTRIDGEAVAAVLVFYFNQAVEYFTPVLRKEQRESQALSAAIYQAMCDASKRGYRLWNWGGTWLSQDGVYRFKSRWGTKDLPYRYFTTVRNPAVLKAGRRALLAGYTSFYTVPFTALSSEEK